MSLLSLGPLSHSLAKGRMVLSGVARCCCKCHARTVVSARTLSSLPMQGTQYEHGHNLQTSCTPSLLLRQTSTTDFSIRNSIFRSKCLFRIGTSAPIGNGSHLDLVYGPQHSSSSCDISFFFSNSMRVQGLHTSQCHLKEESKIEKSVKALKEQAEQLEKEEEEKGKQLGVKPEEPAATVIPAKKPLWQRFIAELKHYYHGFRLLFINIRISTRLVWNILHGKSLTRRERRQLVRTTADIFRLVPFLVFILVPFMEFLLPLAIKLFPNMLPSTFAEENKEQEKRKKNLKLKLEMAKFLQDTLRETALQKKKKEGCAAEEFSQFVEKIRSQGIRPTTKEILKFAKLFENEITLDNLSRQQLQALCRVLGIQPIGIDAFLRFQLEMKLRQLKADDKMIVKEGVDSLSVAELQAANRARGMRALGVSDERLRAQLQQWLTLHLDEHIPTSLLLLSRALYLPEELSAEKQLEATITELTQTAPVTTEEVKLKAAELVGEAVDNKTRLEVVKKEEDIIAAESKAREEAAEAEEMARQVKQEREAAEVLAGKAAMEGTEALKVDTAVAELVKKEELVDKAPDLKGLPGEEMAAAAQKEEEEKEEPISAKELEGIESALGEIAENKHLNIEMGELLDLKEEVNQYKEDLQDLKNVMAMSGKDQDDITESKAAKLLVKRVDRLIEQADSVMQELQVEKERVPEGPEKEEYPYQDIAALRADRQKMAEVMEGISKERVVSVEELQKVMKHLHIPYDAKLQSIVETLDEDHDGKIDINLAFKVLDTLGQEKIRLNKAQLTDIIGLLKAEMELDEQEKLKEKEEREGKEQQKQAEGQS